MMEFHKSAEELQSLRRQLNQVNQLACRSGPKDSGPDGSIEQAQKLEQQLQQFEDTLKEERVLRKGNISVGKWNSEKKTAEVEIAKGVHWNVFGKVVGGKLVLQPEEALYMVDHGMLELYHNDLPMSVQQVYELLLSDKFPLQHYVVYSYLRNLGFIVLRHERKLAQMVGGMDEKLKDKISNNTEGMKEIISPASDEIAVQDMGRESEQAIRVKMNVETKDRMKEIIETVEVEREAGMKEQIGDEMGGKTKQTVDVETEMGKTVKNMEEDKTKILGPCFSENNPVLHYWKEEECQPLVQPSDATSIDNILNKLQIVKNQTMMEASQFLDEPTTFEITFDVFQPQKHFKKSDPGLPNHCICVCKFSETPPSIGEMNLLAEESHPVPLKYAVVDCKNISFYSLLDVQLPTHVES